MNLSVRIMKKESKVRGDHDVSRETFFYISDDQFVKIKRIVESASHESLYKHFFPSYNFEIFLNPPSVLLS